jgi:hypothetical protein
LQRQQELDLREREMKQKQADQYGASNLDALLKATDPKPLLLGDKYHNEVTASELEKVYNDLIGHVRSIDDISFKNILHQKVLDLNNWNNQFSQDFDYSKAKVDDILKNNTNLDAAQAKEIARSELDSKYFKLDENGSITRKSPEEIETNKDPTAILNDPRMQGNIAIGGLDVLKKYIQAQKLHPEDFSKYSSNKGFVNSNAYDIGVSGLKELTHDEHGNPVLKMKTEDFHMGDGVNLKMLPESTFDELMGVPDVASAINKMWNPVAAKIEQHFAQNGGEIDQQSEKMLKRDFVRKQIEDNNLDLSFITQKEKNVIPRPQVSNIFNFGLPNTAVTGSEFDRVGNVEALVGKHSGVKVEKGTVVDKEGNPYDGELVIPTNQLPAGLKNVIKPVLDKFDTVAEYYNVKIENGKIEAIKPSGGNWIDRQDIRNLQLQNNTEPQKGPQKVYGLSNQQQPQSKPSSKKKPVQWVNP